MRRFPAPPTVGGPSTPAHGRSAEAPMQYEWEKPRAFPASPFVAGGGPGDEGLRARKRTHYEAMDVDTPPRPSASTSFPPSATATTNPFGFHQPSNTATATESPHPLAFDAKAFHVEEALGLEKEVELGEISMADESVIQELKNEDVERGKENLALTVHGGGARRRKTSSSRRKPSASPRTGGVTIETDDEGTDEDHAGEGGQEEGFLSVLKSKVGRRAGDNQFSFQVHHHHAPTSFGPGGSSGLGLGGVEEPRTERWLKSGTPYVLLGYLQFTSLALLAILLLSLLLLFLYTLYNDINQRLYELTVSLRAEIIQCAKAYVDNRCTPETRIPAMESRCSGWEECMNREVVVGGKTRVVAETLAEVVNGFVDVISLKTMLFVLLTLGLTIYGSSVALSILPSHPVPAAPATPSPVPAPQFHPHLGMGGYGVAPPGYPPYGLPYGGGGGWVVENGKEREREREQASLGLRAPPSSS
ncbi:hypothetical protein JCM11641_006877 [Rhodosporidiobolus odoratus]